MKKGITVERDWDNTNTEVIYISKARGKLSLLEIAEVLQEEVDWDYYLLVVDAFNDVHERIDDGGDFVKLYHCDQLKTRSDE